MTDCPDCKAATEAMHHGFRSNCSGCMARAISRSLAFTEARSAGKLHGAYRERLARAGVTHEQVKAAALTDAINKKGI